MKNLHRYLDFLLDPLVGGQRGEADNLSLLLQMLDTITTSYEDALDPSSSRIHITARVARQVCSDVFSSSYLLYPSPLIFFVGPEIHNLHPQVMIPGRLFPEGLHLSSVEFYFVYLRCMYYV